jgi:hypothetical protein
MAQEGLRSGQVARVPRNGFMVASFVTQVCILVRALGLVVWRRFRPRPVEVQPPGRGVTAHTAVEAIDTRSRAAAP